MNRRAPTSRVARTKAEANFGYDSLSRWHDTLAGASERNRSDFTELTFARRRRSCITNLKGLR